MQPTPAPSSPPASPKEVAAEETVVYPAPPLNHGSAPFHVLVGLFDKLQVERKPERRKKMLNAWFNVCILAYSVKLCLELNRVVLECLLALAGREGV